MTDQVRDVMKSSLVNIVKESVEAYKNTDRKEWVIDWPGQVVLAGSQIYWTTEVEEVRPSTYCYYRSNIVDNLETRPSTYWSSTVGNLETWQHLTTVISHLSLKIFLCILYFSAWWLVNHKSLTL